MNGSIEWNDTGMPMEEVNQVMQKVVTIVVPFILAVIIVVGVFGNIVVVVVVVCNQQMRSTTNILITNLAMADLLFLVFCAPYTAFDYAFSQWVFGDIWCRIFEYLVYVTACASIYTLVLLSLDRFLAVVYPISSMSIRTTRNAYLAISCMWIVVLVSFIPLFVAFGVVLETSAIRDYPVCVFLVVQGYNFAAFQVSLFVFSYIFPLATIFVLYLLMMKRLRYSVNSSSPSHRSKRGTRLIIVVIVIFAVCWSPVQIIYFLRSIQKFGNFSLDVVLRIVAEILVYFNSCVNPILYAFLSQNFRNAFRKLLNRSSSRACCPCGDKKTVAVGENLNIPESQKGSNDTQETL